MAKVLERDAPRMAGRLRDDIFAALDQQTITVPADRTIGRLIQDLARDLHGLHERRDALERELQGLLADHPLGPILDSLPEIGTKTGVTISARSVTSRGSRPPATSRPTPASLP